MYQDNLYFDGKKRLQEGIAKVARAVGGTMGTAGSNAIIEAIESPGHLMTNDGYSIANSILLADPIEDMGRKILLESINRANKASGDGSSTTCVLTAATIAAGLDQEGEAHPMDIKHQMEECLPIIEASLNDQTEEIVKDGVIDTERLKQVATVSAEDETIGETIANLYETIGPEGIIYWDVSKTTADTTEIGTGIQIEGAGYLSPYMCDANENGQNTNEVRLKNPYILLTKQKISSAADFNKIGETLYNKDITDVIVFCDEYDPLIMQDLVKTRMVRGFRFILVKMPVLWKDWWYEDIALATGATVVDPVRGLSMKELTMKHLGRVGNIIVTKDNTFLDGLADVSAHIEALKSEKTDDADLRAARLNTKTARYFVGAQSESSLSYRRLKVEDAIAAAHHALNGGIVPGGGLALYNAARYMPSTVGGKILATSLLSPIKQIAQNAGLSEIPSGVGGLRGLNTKSRQTVNMFEAGITDPKQIVLNAVTNAISVASTVITAPTIVTLPRMEEEKSQTPQPVVR